MKCYFQDETRCRDMRDGADQVIAFESMRLCGESMRFSSDYECGQARFDLSITACAKIMHVSKPSEFPGVNVARVFYIAKCNIVPVRVSCTHYDMMNRQVSSVPEVPTLVTLLGSLALAIKCGIPIGYLSASTGGLNGSCTRAAEERIYW